MPSLPAVMNELMSYTETPMRLVSELAVVSPAPQAVRANAPTEAIAAIFAMDLMDSLPLRLTSNALQRWTIRLASSTPPGRPHVDRDGGDDQHALDDVLPIRGHDQDVETVVQRHDHEQAEHRSPDAAATAHQARPADHDRGDGVQFVALPEVRWTGDDARCQHDTRQAGQQAGERVHAEQHVLGVDTGDLS